MELGWAHSNGWLTHEVTLALTPDELQQLRFAVSMAVAHGIAQQIFDDFLHVTDTY